MALTATVSRHWDDGKVLHAVGTIVASGNYPANGDTLSLALPSIKSSSLPMIILIQGLDIILYQYFPGTTLANGKVKMLSGPTGIEVTAGTYPPAVTGDTITFVALFPKFR